MPRDGHLPQVSANDGDNTDDDDESQEGDEAVEAPIGVERGIWGDGGGRGVCHESVIAGSGDFDRYRSGARGDALAKAWIFAGFDDVGDAGNDVGANLGELGELMYALNERLVGIGLAGGDEFGQA